MWARSGGEGGRVGATSVLVKAVCQGRELAAGPCLCRPLPLLHPLSLPPLLLPLPPLPFLPHPPVALTCSSVPNCVYSLNFCNFILSHCCSFHCYCSCQSNSTIIRSLELHPLLLSDPSSESCGRGNSGSSWMSDSSSSSPRPFVVSH